MIASTNSHRRPVSATSNWGIMEFCRGTVNATSIKSWRGLLTILQFHSLSYLLSRHGPSLCLILLLFRSETAFHLSFNILNHIHLPHFFIMHANYFAAFLAVMILTPASEYKPSPSGSKRSEFSLIILTLIFLSRHCGACTTTHPKHRPSRVRTRHRQCQQRRRRRLYDDLPCCDGNTSCQRFSRRRNFHRYRCVYCSRTYTVCSG